MTAKLSSLQRDEVKAREKNTAAGLDVWSRRRKWSRTDTARWLDAQSETVLALLRRRPGVWPKHSQHVGHWLKDNAAKIFDRAHAALAIMDSDHEREHALAAEIL